MSKSTSTRNIVLKNYVKKHIINLYQHIISILSTYDIPLLKNCQNEMEHTWKIMKEFTRKSKT